MPPSIRLATNPNARTALIEAFLRGCEEEGVPVAHEHAEGAAAELAREAAARSALFVGAGIDDSNSIAVHEHRIGERSPVIEFTAIGVETARLAGGDAARMVLGRQLRSIARESEALLVQPLA